jgi:hypothetical protein
VSGPDGRRQRVGRTPHHTVRTLDRESLTDPVLDAADHFLDVVAEPGEGERRTGRAVAAGPQQ